MKVWHGAAREGGRGFIGAVEQRPVDPRAPRRAISIRRHAIERIGALLSVAGFEAVTPWP